MGRLAIHSIDGVIDSARGEPTKPIHFFAMDLAEPVALGAWETRSVYLTDMRRPNGTPPLTAAFDRVRSAIQRLSAHAGVAAHTLIMWPDGRDGAPHCVGGGWAAESTTFYVARGQYNGRWCKFLCANVYM